MAKFETDVTLTNRHWSGPALASIRHGAGAHIALHAGFLGNLATEGRGGRDRQSGSEACLRRRQGQRCVVPLSPHLQPLFDALLAAHPNGLTLDELSEELSNKPVTYGDIDELVGALEGAGLDLETAASVGQPDELARVLVAVRALIAETGKKPSTDEIAARAGLTPTVVRRALRLGGSVTP